MTWVVGMPTILGTTIGISDICVSGDGWQLDCLQKIHPIAPGVAMAFAGSVVVGFAMVDRLRNVMATMPIENYQNIAEIWQPMAQQTYESFDEKARRGRCHLMLFVADPVKNAGEAPWEDTRGYIFRDSAFQPELIPNLRATAIGSGVYEERCVEALERIMERENFDGLLKASMAGPGAMASVLAFDFSRTLQDALPPGISPHLHICVTMRGVVSIVPNDYQTFTSSGPVNFTMPPVAQSMAELALLLKRAGHPIAEIKSLVAGVSLDVVARRTV